MGLFITVTLALMAFIIRLSTGDYTLPAILAVCMFLSTFFVFFSFYKMRFWQDKLKIHALFLDEITIFINAEAEKDD